MSTNSLTNQKSPLRAKKSLSSNSKIQAEHSLSDECSLPRSPSSGKVCVENRPIQSYKDEMVAAFFASMLSHIIDKKEICEEFVLEPSALLSNSDIIKSKDFKDLVDNDFIEQEVVSVDGSQVSLGSKIKKIGSKRSGSIASKRSSQGQSGVKSPTGSLGRKRKHIKSISSTLPRISESDNNKNTPDFYNDAVIESWRVKGECQECVLITFKNGNIYQGPLRNNLFHGEGSFFWNDGTYYFGHFELGEITGFGKMVYSDMSAYYGHFFNGKPHGIGVFFMAYTKTLYNGHWVHGKKEGKGWLYYSENNWYDGDWHNDCRGGFGTRQYRNGTKYTGMWENGVRNGHGACAFKNGDFYSGEWLGGESHGYGEYTWGSYFNKSLTFPIENIYQGQWTFGKRNGFGHLYFGLEHGARLIGFWDMNFKHGMGIIINSNGDVTERTPLFFNDKPAHLTNSDNSTLYNQPLKQQQSPVKTHKYSVNSMNVTPTSSQGWLLRTTAHKASSLTQTSVLSEMNAQTSVLELMQSTNSEQRPSVFNWVKENSGPEQNSNVQKIERLQDFPQERLLCNPLILHTRTAPETLNLTFYVNMYIDEAKEQINSGAMSKTQFQFYSSEQNVQNDDNFWLETSEHEINNLRNVIWHNTSVLQIIYEMYANISNDPDAPNRKCTLIRLYLWQLYRDILIYKDEVSLFETDEILLENPGHCFETDHHPFERIYYWQFLWSLIGVAWKIHVNKKNKIEAFQLQSIYIVFEDFLKTTVFPKAGHHKGPCLFECKNLLPINDVIAFYEHVGPVLTARQFLNKCCCKKHSATSCYMQNFGDNSVIQPEYGTNTIAVGRNFFYLPDKEDNVLTKNQPNIYPLEIDNFFKTLKVFRHIGPQRVINCLTLACPIIKRDDFIVNLDVKLTFLEFYETIIYCAYKSVLLANLNERCKNFVFDDRGSRSEKYDKRKKGRKDTRKRKK